MDIESIEGDHITSLTEEIEHLIEKEESYRVLRQQKQKELRVHLYHSNIKSRSKNADT